ncbi:hypothetical protein O9993_17340 [Vibrio lentus]|nr:hypothetical protein [Vibrio lentus]
MELLENNSILYYGSVVNSMNTKLSLLTWSMIVAQQERGKGLATRVLNFLTQRHQPRRFGSDVFYRKQHRGAQKAMKRAGLSSKEPDHAIRF